MRKTSVVSADGGQWLIGDAPVAVVLGRELLSAPVRHRRLVAEGKKKAFPVPDSDSVWLQAPTHALSGRALGVQMDALAYALLHWKGDSI